MAKQPHEIKITHDDVENFEEAMYAIKENLENAYRVVKHVYGYDLVQYQRMKGYWYAHIKMHIDKDHSYLGGGMFTMEDMLNELNNELYSEESPCVECGEKPEDCKCTL